MKTLINNILRRFGIEIRRFPNYDHSRRLKVMQSCNINTVLDVGANSGQYGLMLRRIGYTGRIVSFEPLSEAFNSLSQTVQPDKLWSCDQMALGSKNQTAFINVAGNSESSSILSMLPRHLAAEPASAFTNQEKVYVKTLDTIFESYVDKSEKVLLKLDVQGYEQEVLEGASKSLALIDMIQIELSLQPLYEHETTYLDMISYLSDRGYRLVSLEPGFSDPNTGELLQTDGIFIKSR